MAPPLCNSAAEPGADLDQALQAAEDLRRQAAGAGFEWLDTAALVRQAQQAMASGDRDAAWRYVEQANTQSRQALEQAAREAEAWRRRVLK